MEEIFRNEFAIHAAAGVGSVALATALTYPLDTLKVLIQVGSSNKKPLIAADAMYRVLVLSGVSGLYNGLGWLTVGRTLGLGMRFGVYEIVTAFYRDGRRGDFVSPSEAVMAGCVAGAVECVVSSPFEIVKIRSQVASASRVTTIPLVAEKNVVPPLASRLLPGYSMDIIAMSNSVELLSPLNTRRMNLLDAFKQYPWMISGSGRPPSACSVRSVRDIFSLEGLGALWRSLRAGLFRDSIFGGVFFSTWEVLHQEMIDWKISRMDPKPRYYSEVGPLSPLSISLTAGISGAFAAAVSHSFDTTRTRSQCNVTSKYVTMERRFLKWPRPGNRFERLSGIHPADRNLLMKGIWHRMGRCGIASSVMVGS
ncbi:hypothetical protein M569_12711, partial [Genlisea aurea]